MTPPNRPLPDRLDVPAPGRSQHTAANRDNQRHTGHEQPAAPSRPTADWAGRREKARVWSDRIRV
jgi:hypothetical protein